jgi:peptidoglycan/xylan/chitin deacetylase (PgdA/CDA1 family)
MKAILTYHSIDPSGSVISLSPERFREHMDLLVGRRVPVLRVRDLLAPQCAAGVALTFDDGFENFATIVWPILRDRNLPASVYVATDWVGRDNAWDPADARIPRMSLMDWPTLADLAREGLEVGSHTRSHPRLPSLSDADLDRELGEARETITARLGREVMGLAYPYGDYDARVATATQRAGYEYALTTELQLLSDESAPCLALPRIDAFYLAKPGVMEMWGTPALRRYLVFRRAARRARATLSRMARRP